MNLGEWWQENKRFAVTVASGVIVFVIGAMVIDSTMARDLTATQGQLRTTRRKLETETLYSAEQLAVLMREHEALSNVTEALKQGVAFAPRPGFVLDPARGAAANQYFQTVSSVREDLLTLAGRANLRLPEDLGLPALSPTKEPEIARYLEGLDLVDRLARMALASGVARVDKLAIQLDPKLKSKDGVGALERTRVVATLSGAPGALVQFLLATQAAAGGGPLILEKSEMLPARTKTDEAVLEATFQAVRLHETQPAETP